MAMSGDRKNKRRTNHGSEIYCRPRKKVGFGSCSASHVVAQMLAASSRINTDLGLSTIVGLQDMIITYLHSSSRDSSTVEELLSEGLLAVLPTLLASSLPQILLQTAEIIGGAALWSYEMNTKVANDKEIVSALVAMLSNQNKDIARGACNAVMDLATTSVGREKLRDCRVIDQLLWEGMMHIALHSWAQHQKWDDFVPISNSGKKCFLAVQLLHIAIRNLGDSCSLLRKACTVATPYSCYISSKEWEAQFGLDANSDTLSCQINPKAFSCKEVFSNLIGIVARRCIFADAYRIVEVSLNNLADDSFQWMKWLRHLASGDTNSSDLHSWDDPYKLLREMFKADQSDVLEYESAFLRVKSKFCNEVKIEEAQSGFAFLLRKYRRARKQFINGMLALHSK